MEPYSLSPNPLIKKNRNNKKDICSKGESHYNGNYKDHIVPLFPLSELGQQQEYACRAQMAWFQENRMKTRNKVRNITVIEQKKVIVIV